MLGTPLGRILLDRPAWTYLLGPFFKASTPDAAAPLPATYREAGAVGALTVTDASSIVSVSGGRLAINGTPGANTQLLAASELARVAGRAILATLVSRAVLTGVPRLVIGTANLDGFRFTTGNTFTVGDNAVVVTTETIAGVLDLALVARAVGTFFLARVAGTSAYTVLWVSNLTTQTIAPKWFTSNVGAVNITAANLRVADLGGAWASAYGIATDRKATSAATDTITHTANCLIEHTITAATGVTQELWVRRTDASNGWIVRMDQAGSTIKLIELVAGVETERASSAQTWTNGTAYRVVVICDGQTIVPYVANVAKTGYASATTNQSATTAYVDTAGSELIAWPRTVSLPTGV